VTYRVNAEWDNAGWWTVTVPDVSGAITQSRRLEQVPNDAAEAISIQTGLEVDPSKLEIIPIVQDDDNDLSPAEVRQLRAEAEQLAAKALDRTATLVIRLHRRGFALRDIGSLAGISYQRAQQIVKEQNTSSGEAPRKPRQRRRSSPGRIAS
jgi:predicted RNase H-like HicB family nuclease